MADGNYPDIYADDDSGRCAGCGRLPEQVEAIAGPAAGPAFCVDCVDGARAALEARAARGSARRHAAEAPARAAEAVRLAACVICERRPGVRVGALEDAPSVCRDCLAGLAEAMAEPD
jgi:hypothetical protein